MTGNITGGFGGTLLFTARAFGGALVGLHFRKLAEDRGLEPHTLSGAICFRNSSDASPVYLPVFYGINSSSMSLFRSPLKFPFDNEHKLAEVTGFEPVGALRPRIISNDVP